MIRYVIILISVFVFILPIFSQNDQIEIEIKPTDSLSIENNSNYGLIQNISSRDFLLPALKINFNHFSPYNSFSFDVKTIPPNKAITFNNKYTYEIHPEISGYQPFIRDFYKSKTDKLFNRFSVSRGSRQVTYPGLGEYFQISGALRWMPNKNLSLDIGGFFAREYNYLSTFRSDISGVNGQMIYYLTDNLQFNIFGQYVAPSQKNIFNGNALFPNSTIGGSLLYKGKGNMQIEVGSKYQYYQNQRSWNAESGGKILFGF